MTSQKLEVIDNAASYTNTGNRDVAFMRDLSLSPVWFNRTHGYRSGRCSIQLLGPIIAHSSWGRKEIEFSLSVDGVRTPVYKVVHTRNGDVREVSPEASVATFALWVQLQEHHPWLLDFLAGESGMYVPWEGEPLALVKKREKWWRFRDRFGVDITPWIDRKVDIEFLNGSAINLDTVEEVARNGHSQHCSAETEIFYFGSDGKGRGEKLDFTPTILGVGPNTGRGSRGRPGVANWRSWRYVVRVRVASGHTGRQSRNHTSVQVFKMAA